MNPHLAASTSSLALLKTLFHNRHLIISLTKREITSRYKGSSLGLLWSFVTPIMMLVVYTFVFSIIFKAKWVGGSDSKIEFALILFAGLMVFNLFSECISRAPSLITQNVNYVKKVIFPLEILPIVTFGAALFHFMISFIIWLIFYIIFIGTPHVETFFLFLILIPLFLYIIGISWFLASFGVYFRDISHIIGVIITLLMFLSAIFYPVSSLPESYQSIMQINPLTVLVEQTRETLIWGHELQVFVWVKQLILSTITAWIGFIWFQKTRKGFADVI